MVAPNLVNTVFAKNQYNTVIDTTFTELIQPQSQDPTQPATITVAEFFDYYDSLFFEIPKFGETNSHEYLIKKSSEYVDFEKDQTLINELQKEIAQLRTDLLDTQKLNVDLQVEIATVRSKIA